MWLLTVSLLTAFMSSTLRPYILSALIVLSLTPLPSHPSLMKVGEWIMLGAAHYFGLTLISTDPEALKAVNDGSITTLEVRKLMCVGFRVSRIHARVW